MLTQNIENTLLKVSRNEDKIFYKNHPYRTKSSSESLSKALKLKNKIGVTRINYLTELDNTKIPVFGVTRPNIDIRQYNTSTQGKGSSLWVAILSALMESYEHHAANTFSGIHSYSEDFLEKNKINFLSHKDFGVEFTSNDIFDWVSGIHINQSISVLIPASLVLFPYIPMSQSKYLRIPPYPSTNGLASGNTVIEATMFAIFEMIERHALSCFVSKGRFQYISLLEARQYSQLEDIISKLSENNRICILLLENPFDIPVAFVSLVSENPTSPPIAVTGHACRTSILDAIYDSLLEAAQVHSAVLQSSREDLVRMQKVWIEDHETLIKKWDMINNSISFGHKNKINIEELNKNESIFGKCFWLSNKIISKNYDIYFSNLTNPSVDMPVVRVVIPGFRDDANNIHFERSKEPHVSYFFYGV